MIRAVLVIVTYNRLALLKECLSFANDQLVKYEKIIVINNNSSDGTADYLDGLNNIQVVHMSENIGGAGGFCEGMRRAYETDCDWITVIDDDAMLDKEYLKNISSFVESNPEVKAVSGHVFTNNKTSLGFARRLVVNSYGEAISFCVPISEYKNDYFWCDEVTFCGLTFSKKLIDKIGYPNDRFFIYYDDTEYSHRIRECTQIACITNACINHKVNKSIPSDWKQYYSVRNELYMIKKHFGVRAAIIKTLELEKKVYEFLNSSQQIKYRKRVIIDGTIDAWLGRLGKNKKYQPKY